MYLNYIIFAIFTLIHLNTVQILAWPSNVDQSRKHCIIFSSSARKCHCYKQKYTCAGIITESFTKICRFFFNADYTLLHKYAFESNLKVFLINI